MPTTYDPKTEHNIRDELRAMKDRSGAARQVGRWICATMAATILLLALASGGGEIVRRSLLLGSN